MKKRIRRKKDAHLYLQLKLYFFIEYYSSIDRFDTKSTVKYDLMTVFEIDLQSRQSEQRRCEDLLLLSEK